MANAFPECASDDHVMGVSNTRYLSSSETRVNAGIRGWMLHLSESTWCQESVGGTSFTNSEEQLLYSPDIFKPLLGYSIFKCISWLNGSFFGAWTLGFSERVSQDISNSANVASEYANFFFVCTSIVFLHKRQEATPTQKTNNPLSFDGFISSYVQHGTVFKFYKEQCIFSPKLNYFQDPIRYSYQCYE